MSKHFYLKKNQFSISSQFSYIWNINKNLGVFTLEQSGPGSNGNEGVFRITQSLFDKR